MAFRKANYKNPCPICGKTDWCLVTEDANICICMRVEEGSFTTKYNRDGVPQYFHKLNGDEKVPPPQEENPRKEQKEIWNIFKKSRRNLYDQKSPKDLLLSKQLGIPIMVLRSLGLGILLKSDLEKAGLTCYDDRPIWSFPMYTGSGRVAGFRLRNPDGVKFALSGGTDGIFKTSINLTYPKLYVVEGPTDCAALLSMGYPTIGRPNNAGGVADILQFVKRNNTKEVHIIMDKDPSENERACIQTLKGGKKLQFELTKEGVRAKLAYVSGAKDVRELYNKGADVLTIEEGD